MPPPSLLGRPPLSDWSSASNPPHPIRRALGREPRRPPGPFGLEGGLQLRHPLPGLQRERIPTGPPGSPPGLCTPSPPPLFHRGLALQPSGTSASDGQKELEAGPPSPLIIERGLTHEGGMGEAGGGTAGWLPANGLKHFSRSFQAPPTRELSPPPHLSGMPVQPLPFPRGPGMGPLQLRGGDGRHQRNHTGERKEESGSKKRQNSEEKHGGRSGEVRATKNTTLHSRE